MRKKQKIIILLLLIIGEIIATSFLYKTTKKEDTFLENMTLKESVDNKNFAIFIQKEKGSSEYIPYTESTKWPTDYDFNSTLSNCISGNGTKVENILSFDASEKRVYVKNAKEAVYCNIYFDIPNPIPLPTCHFEIINNGIAGVKLVTENADSWDLSTELSNNPDYGTEEYIPPLGTNIYYGYVKNKSGIGTCKLDMYQANEKKCTVTDEESWRYQMCTHVTETCVNGNSSSNSYREVCSDSTCNDSSGWYVPKCDETNKNWTQNHCYSWYETQTLYTCSNGQTYSTEADCTNKSCGVEECKEGYEKLDMHSAVYCYKNIT